ncbi:hypothetical protein JW921_01295 [Candidatus Fermentibacterales bacterium]|nr:hypothetical protein [Candidatus Fermentibacterales bacterium]
MAFAYTPGLRVASVTRVRKERRLPLKGTVVVAVGDEVEAGTIVARTELPGNVQVLNLANRMGLPPADIPEFLLKNPGDPVEQNEPIARSKGFLGLFKSTVRSPIEGQLDSYSEITGQVLLREPPVPVEIDAYVKGKVVEVIEDEGVVVETRGTFVQGIFGIGGETRGELKVVVDSSDQELTADLLDPSCSGKVLVGGCFVSHSTLTRAIGLGVRAVVVGGFDDKDLKDFLGYDLGVAITGHETKGITLILTEGFGRMNMAQATFDLLRSRQGLLASVNGATQIRAGVIRPELVIPVGGDVQSAQRAEREAGALDSGSQVRLIRAPYFGRLAKVTKLPPELQELDSESKARVLEVQFDDGERAIVPRANVELIEH